MRIENANLRPQSPVRDSGLYMHLRQIADGDARGLTAGTGGGGHGNMRPQRAGYGDAFADRRVDVVQKFGGVGGIEIGRFGRVDRGSASYRKVSVEVAFAGKFDGVMEGNVGRLHPNLIVEDRIDPLRPQGSQGHRHRLAVC